MPPSTSYPRGSELWRQTWNLGIAFEDRCRGKVSFHLGDVDTEVLNWGGVNDSNLIGAYYLARWRCPFNCFELSYHRDGELRPLTRQTWREMARCSPKRSSPSRWMIHMDKIPRTSRAFRPGRFRPCSAAGKPRAGPSPCSLMITGIA